jgi:peptide/nickel transport system substrate-binding protein
MIVSIANPGYPSASTPDRVEYQVFADEFAAVSALTGGEIDTILSPKGLTSAQAEELSSDPSVVVKTSPANGIRYLGFNLDREPMSDIAFRNAIALLIDRDSLAEEIGPNGASTYAFVNAANSRWFDEESAGSIAARFQGALPDRLAAALDGLRDAGYSWTTEPTIGPGGDVVPGVGLKIQGLVAAPLTILTTGDALDPWRPQYASEIAGALGWVGFDVRPVETDFDTVVDLAFTPGEQDTLQYDMYLLGWTLGNPSLPGYYRALFSSDGGQNNTGYASSAFASQLAAYEGSFNVAEAREALWDMEETLATDLPYLLLYSSALTEAYRADQVVFDGALGLGGLQAQLGGIGDVRPAS